MRRAAAWALLLAVAGMGMSGAAEDPFSGEHIYSPLRTLALATPVSEYGKVVEAVRHLAEADGYTFRVGSPTGRPESVSLTLWTRDIIVSGSNVPEPDMVRFDAYWNGDVADDAALDRVTERLRARLAPFGPIVVTKALPGAAPRRMPRGR